MNKLEIYVNLTSILLSLNWISLFFFPSTILFAVGIFLLLCMSIILLFLQKNWYKLAPTSKL